MNYGMSLDKQKRDVSSARLGLPLEGSQEDLRKRVSLRLVAVSEVGQAGINTRDRRLSRAGAGYLLGIPSGRWVE